MSWTEKIGSRICTEKSKANFIDDAPGWWWCAMVWWDCLCETSISDQGICICICVLYLCLCFYLSETSISKTHSSDSSRIKVVWCWWWWAMVWWDCLCLFLLTNRICKQKAKQILLEMLVCHGVVGLLVWNLHFWSGHTLHTHLRLEK